MATIVLAHGILGFGDPTGGLLPVNYFNGVAKHLEDQGHHVLEPQVNPVGSVAERGGQLADEIARKLDGVSGIHILAHSMGGLDARYAIANVPGFAGRIATLVTIGTPHRGSPVADAVVARTGPLFPHIPTFLLQQLEQSAGGLNDLTTEVCIPFDESTRDDPGVRYVEVAGDASRGGHELLLFQLAAILGQLTDEVNDGVVTRSSALREGHEHLDDWPADHAGEIGWSLHSFLPVQLAPRFFGPPPHLAWYDAIVAML